MNRLTGQPLTPAICSDIEMLSKDLFKMQIYDSYEWHLLNTDGNIAKTK